MADKNYNRINYYCIMLEGLFNTLGTDILGLTTIVPLFLNEFHASMTLIGMLTTAQSILQGITPLLAGGFIAVAASKKKWSMLFNGISRGSILLVPLILLLHFPDSAVVTIFFAILLVYFCLQSMTGIIWNNLLGDCVDGKSRGKLVGTLFALSGLITFGSTNLVKFIRDNQGIGRNEKYALIFGLAGVLMTVSVLCFIPLKENNGTKKAAGEKMETAVYLRELIHCFKNRDYNWLLATNIFSQASFMISGFIFLYAQNFLKLPTEQVSTLLVVQTVGVIAGGFVTGQISSRFGSKRMLLFIETMGIGVPIFNILAGHSANPFGIMCIAVFLIGIYKSGNLGYQTHLLEIVPPEKKTYFIVCKSMSLLPVSLVSTLVGRLLQQVSGQSAMAVQPIYLAQIAIALVVVFSASHLKLVVYSENQKEKA